MATAWAFSRATVGYNGDMHAVVLGWDPDRGTRWVPPYEHALAQSAAQGTITSRYRMDGPVPPVGTTVHLMLQGRTRGLVGHGTVRSAPFRSADPARPGAIATYALVEWDHLLPVEERIRPEELAARVPEVAWTSLYGPGTPLDEDQSDRLDRVWRAPHPSSRAGRSRLARAAGHLPSPPSGLTGLAARLLHR
jgi:5-methylcytosine-specific restriction protein A